MQYPIAQTSISTAKASHNIISKLSSLGLLLVLSACGSMCNRAAQMDHVLGEETALIAAMKAERDQAAIKQRVGADPVTAAAEAHLGAALDALMRATQDLKSSF